MSDEIDYVERIRVAVDDAYRSGIMDYHKALGMRIAIALAVWIPEESVEDVIGEIAHAAREVKELIELDYYSKV